jgi:hypothetical protein
MVADTHHVPVTVIDNSRTADMLATSQDIMAGLGIGTMVMGLALWFLGRQQWK